MPDILCGFNLAHLPEARRILESAGTVTYLEYDRETLATRLPAVDILCPSLRVRVTREMLEHAPRLRCIATPSTGTDHLDLGAARELGITVFSLKDDIEFLRSVIDDLFTDQVFVFTPRGDVIDLPAGSTPVDFAYRIHSDLGNRCAGAKVNGRIVPLTYKFSNGDIVEVISRGNITPSLDWLNFVKTSTARSRIKAYFRRLRHAESVVKGREMLEKEVERLGLDRRELLKPEHLQKLLEPMNVPSEEDLLAAVGYGHIPALAVIHKLTDFQPVAEGLTISGKKPAVEARLGIVAGGVDDVAIRRSKCCTPVPGDEVIGYVTRGRGLALHRKGCPNVAVYCEKEPDRIVQVEWRDSEGERFQTGLRIEALDRLGLLTDISAMFSETKTNINSAKIKSYPNKTATFELTIEVSDLDHLNALMTRIGGLSDILAVRRTSISEESA